MEEDVVEVGPPPAWVPLVSLLILWLVGLVLVGVVRVCLLLGVVGAVP